MIWRDVKHEDIVSERSVCHEQKHPRSPAISINFDVVNNMLTHRLVDIQRNAKI